MKTAHNHDPSGCPRFRITTWRGGIVEIDVCWDQMKDAAEVARDLRAVADGLDKIPPGVQQGIIPV